MLPRGKRHEFRYHRAFSTAEIYNFGVKTAITTFLRYFYGRFFCHCAEVPRCSRRIRVRITLIKYGEIKRSFIRDICRSWGNVDKGNVIQISGGAFINECGDLRGRTDWVRFFSKRNARVYCSDSSREWLIVIYFAKPW